MYYVSTGRYGQNIRRTLKTEYTFIRYETVMKSYISGEREDDP